MATTITVDERTLTIPTDQNGKDVPWQNIVFPVTPKDHPVSRKISYEWKIGSLPSQYCKEWRSSYWLEFKFYPLTNSLSNYFDYRFTVNGKSIQGDTAHQYTPARFDATLNLELEFSLKNNVLYGGERAIIPQGSPLIAVSMFCIHNLDGGDDFNYSNQKQAYSKFNVFKITSAADAEVAFDKTCSLSESSKNLVVNLDPVQLSILNRDTKVKGKDFTISLNCQNAVIKQSYIAVSDALDPTNMSTILTTESGDNAAKGVGIQIDDENGIALKYGPLSLLPFAYPTDNNLTLFSNIVSGARIVTKKYTASYIKNNKSELTAGSVKAKVIYNLYYQ
ncbi:fimbrial protein [Gallibacterium melopsittaci]|uniref:Fimbrial protein n=1 Tax=Gallibacterium melopsittaci TaxID=516063 RepID=A0ABV6HZZ0_9PAST